MRRELLEGAGHRLGAGGHAGVARLSAVFGAVAACAANCAAAVHARGAMGRESGAAAGLVHSGEPALVLVQATRAESGALSAGAGGGEVWASERGAVGDDGRGTGVVGRGASRGG